MGTPRSREIREATSRREHVMAVNPTPLTQPRAPHHYSLVILAAVAVLGVIGGVMLARLDVFDGSSGSNGVEGSGNASSEWRDVAAFNGVELAGSNNVIVRVRGKQGVVVHADDNLLDHVTTDVQAGTLVIDEISGSLKTKSPMYVEVTAPALDSLTLSGSGIVSVTHVDATRFSVNLPGSGVVRASGTATRLDVTLGGSGDAQLQGLTADNVTANVSGSGRILVRATNSLDASVSGSGAVMYLGSPESITKNVTGTGAVIGG
jgi:hypothetical protein